MTLPPELTGALLVRFEVDARDERVLARVRATAAVVAASASVLLLLGDLPVPVFLVGVLGLFVSVLWFRYARRAAHRVTQAGDHFLAVYRDGLLLSEGERRVAVLWTQVQDVTLDEERLDVVVTRQGAPPLRIEPRYAGVEIHQLVRTLRNAWRGLDDC